MKPFRYNKLLMLIFPSSNIPVNISLYRNLALSNLLGKQSEPFFKPNKAILTPPFL